MKDAIGADGIFREDLEVAGSRCGKSAKKPIVAEPGQIAIVEVLLQNQNRKFLTDRRGVLCR